MKFSELNIPGCFIINPFHQKDRRGDFIKTFHEEKYKTHGLQSSFKEEFISISHKNVLRGMHFQIPPAAQDKLIYCIKGCILDGFIDLRKGSPTFKNNLTVTLSELNRDVLFLPKGIAHGFLTKSHEAIVVYKTSKIHCPQYDAGILWQNCGINWPIKNPIISDRDQEFPVLNTFSSPFKYRLK